MKIKTYPNIFAYVGRFVRWLITIGAVGNSICTAMRAGTPSQTEPTRWMTCGAKEQDAEEDGGDGA
jgi:hypothetical protein